MISKRSFTMLLKDDLKKRSWLLVMSFLVFCLIFPGVILDNIQGMISIYGETDLSPRFLNALTYSGNNYYALAVVLMAAICALTGFSYIYSRPKLDFYHSLPVKRETWLLLKAASGLVIFAGATGAARHADHTVIDVGHAVVIALGDHEAFDLRLAQRRADDGVERLAGRLADLRALVTGDGLLQPRRRNGAIPVYSAAPARNNPRSDVCSPRPMRRRPPPARHRRRSRRACPRP